MPRATSWDYKLAGTTQSRTETVVNCTASLTCL